MEQDKDGNMPAKTKVSLNIFAQMIGYLLVVTVMVLSVTFWITGNIEYVAQTALIGVFVTPVIGITIFLVGLVSRWNHGTSKHIEVVGILSIFVWILPTIIFFIMK